jgi:hypothetical protein
LGPITRTGRLLWKTVSARPPPAGVPAASTCAKRERACTCPHVSPALS